MLWWKALHILAIISWMAGLLYLLRLYIYHNVETELVVRQRFEIMERRLLNQITTPAAIVSLISGTAIVYLNPALLDQPWFRWKLLLVVGMFGIHGAASRMRRTLLKTNHPYNNVMLRFLNEVPTLLMIGIVLLVILKP